jgi:DNA transposition AAA+ family ATPase
MSNENPPSTENPNEQPQITEWDEGLRKWLKGYVESHPHQPTAVLSRAQYIGVSRKALDSYIAGTYFLPKDYGGEGVDPKASKIEHAIRAFRERVDGSPRHGYSRTFIETRTWFQVQEACATAINENAIVVIVGKPGVGKTRSLIEYSARKMSTAPLSILCSSNITTHYFVQRMAQELKLHDRGTTSRLEDMIIEKLRRYPRPLFVDQANYLKEKALGSVCYIWEMARIPIVLAGTNALHTIFATSKLTEEVREQLSSRIAIYYLLAELTLPEAKAIIKRGLGEEATDETVAQVITITGGIHRHVDMIIPRILDLREKNQAKLEAGTVTIEQIIRVAGSRMMACL